MMRLRGRSRRVAISADETFVEIAEAHADKFMAKLGKDRLMDRGIRVTRLDAAPDFSKFSRGTDDEGFTKREGPRMDKPWKDKPFKDGPKKEGFRKDKPFAKDGPRGDKAFGDKPFRDKPFKDEGAPRKDWKSKNMSGGDKVSTERRMDDDVWGEKPKGGFAKKGGDKPYGDKPAGDRPFKKKAFGDKPFAKADGDKPFKKKPAGKGGFDKRK
jgi:ATP-dependent RNA helicase DeaD